MKEQKETSPAARGEESYEGIEGNFSSRAQIDEATETEEIPQDRTMQNIDSALYPSMNMSFATKKY